MTAITIAQLAALAMIIIWIVIIAVVARACIKGAEQEIYTQAELSQMLSTENQKHQRPRLRAGVITEIKNGS